MPTFIRPDPLDALLFAIGLRLAQLNKSGDERFKSLLENRCFTIEMGAESENIQRYFHVNQGQFQQFTDKQQEPTLTITFKDSMTGVKLLTKGDATAFMVGLQNGDVKMTGDYSLLMWFNQVARYIIPKIPTELRPFVEQATPIAKKLANKAVNLYQQLMVKKTKTQQHFQDVTDDIKETAQTLEKQAIEQVEQAKQKITDMADEIKIEIEQTLDQVTDTTPQPPSQTSEMDDNTSSTQAKTNHQPLKADNSLANNEPNTINTDDNAKKNQPNEIEEPTPQQKDTPKSKPKANKSNKQKKS